MSERAAVDHTTDPRAGFDALFHAHHDAIYRYCLRRLGPGDAEDAAAEVFAVAWRRLEALRAIEGSRAWLFGVAHRVVGNHYRSRRRRRRLAALVAADRSAGPATLGAVADYEDLYAALDQLSSVDQELLQLSAWDGLDRSEIAQVLGIKENAVDQRLHRARTRLKARLGPVQSESLRPETKESSA